MNSLFCIMEATPVSQLVWLLKSVQTETKSLTVLECSAHTHFSPNTPQLNSCIINLSTTVKEKETFIRVTNMLRWKKYCLDRVAECQTIPWLVHMLMNANVHKAMNTDHSPTLEAQVECEKPGMDDLKNIYIYIFSHKGNFYTTANICDHIC